VETHKRISVFVDSPQSERCGCHSGEIQSDGRERKDQTQNIKVIPRVFEIILDATASGLLQLAREYITQDAYENNLAYKGDKRFGTDIVV
jgi:hypothetical protein